MARLSKARLFAKVEDSISDCGWSYLRMSATGDHPALYNIYRNDALYKVRVYIWNVTPGGNNRPENEYRIQVTGIGDPVTGQQRFTSDAEHITLILGWWDDVGVFAGFDLAKHSSVLGGSPSLQISRETLEQAVANNFGLYEKANGETAIAFRPEYFIEYLSAGTVIHSAGGINAETALLDQISRDPYTIDDERIRNTVAGEREYAFVSTKKVLRDISFKNRVLTAYGHKCAICNIQLRLLDAAHILPVAHPDSNDLTSNGISLCTLHHRAYDRSLITFDGEYRVHLNEGMCADLRNAGLHGGLEQFREGLRPILNLPPDERDRPHPDFVNLTNTLRGWDF